MSAEISIRPLRADEIDCRVQTVRENGCSLLLYKDARCDMNILDETFGPMNWKRNHYRDNANCIVSVWDEQKGQWIEKDDTGTESNTEKEKGLASDSFKRSCVNWGIGRELYTSPFIWINLYEGETSEKTANGKTKYDVKTKFHVSKIEYNDNKEITLLEIKDGKQVLRYRYKTGAIEDPKEETKSAEFFEHQKRIDKLQGALKERGIDEADLCKKYKVEELFDLTKNQLDHIFGKMGIA